MFSATLLLSCSKLDLLIILFSVEEVTHVLLLCLLIFYMYRGQHGLIDELIWIFLQYLLLPWSDLSLSVNHTEWMWKSVVSFVLKFCEEEEVDKSPPIGEVTGEGTPHQHCLRKVSVPRVLSLPTQVSYRPSVRKPVPNQKARKPSSWKPVPKLNQISGNQKQSPVCG